MRFETCESCRTPDQCLDDIRWACSLVSAIVEVAEEDVEMLGAEVAFRGEPLTKVNSTYDMFTRKFVKRGCELSPEQLRVVISATIDSI